MEHPAKLHGATQKTRTANVYRKSSKTRNILKKDNQKGYLKGTVARKTHLPTLRTTQMQKDIIDTTKSISIGKSVPSKRLVKLSHPTVKPSKDGERRNIPRSSNVSKKNDASKSNLNLLKQTFRSRATFSCTHI